MAKSFAEDYRDKYMPGQPPVATNPYEKPEKEFLQRCQHYYGMYAYGDTVFGYGGVTRNGVNFKELRDYAAGLMSPDKYKDILDPLCTNKKTKRQFRKWTI